MNVYHINTYTDLWKRIILDLFLKSPNNLLMGDLLFFIKQLGGLYTIWDFLLLFRIRAFHFF